jgi:hypothetical protein
VARTSQTKFAAEVTAHCDARQEAELKLKREVVRGELARSIGESAAAETEILAALGTHFVKLTTPFGSCYARVEDSKQAEHYVPVLRFYSAVPTSRRTRRKYGVDRSEALAKLSGGAYHG